MGGKKTNRKNRYNNYKPVSYGLHYAAGMGLQRRTQLNFIFFRHYLLFYIKWPPISRWPGAQRDVRVLTIRSSSLCNSIRRFSRQCRLKASWSGSI